MATRDTQKLSVRVSPKIAGFRDYTIPSENILDWNPGEKKETVTHSDPAIDGSVSTLIKKNNSRDTSTLRIKTGSTSEAYLDELAQNDVPCDIVVIDESSNEYGKEIVGTDVFFSDPGAAFEDLDKEYGVMMADYGQKRV